MKAVFWTHLAWEFPEELKSLQADHPGHQYSVPEGEQDFFEQIKDAEILVTGRMDEATIEKAPELHTLIIPFTGFNRLNRDQITKRRITVFNNHGNARSVAERGFALLLALLGRVIEFDGDLRQGYWHRTGEFRRPFEYWESLHGKSMVFLGTGAISREMTQLVQPFGVKCYGFNQTGSGPDEFLQVSTSLDEALSWGDIVVVALPLTGKTSGLLGPPEIALLTGKHVLNLARGEIIHESSFYTALEKRKIPGAALDAWWDYPSKEPGMPSEFPFQDLNNVVFSPHAASHSIRGKRGQWIGALDCLRQVFGESLGIRAVELQRGY